MERKKQNLKYLPTSYYEREVTKFVKGPPPPTPLPKLDTSVSSFTHYNFIQNEDFTVQSSRILTHL